jgi:hypothetical protein
MKLTQSTDALKAIGNIILGPTIRNLPRDHTRQQAVAEVIKQATEAGLDGENRRFVCDYMMAQMGYGGGI